MNDISEKIAVASRRLSAAIDAVKPVAVFGLFSGGHDSLSATYVASLHPRFTAAVHIDTGIGVERTRQFVRDTCARRGWKLLVYRAEDNCRRDGAPDPQRYRDIVLKYGFPGPAGHGLMYARLKQRQLQRLERDYGARACRPRRIVLYVSGCRTDESQRRMANTSELELFERRAWCAPIHDWSKLDTSHLIAHARLERNPVVDLIHKSGECLCGAFASAGELEELALWPETRPAYDLIVALEKEVRAAGFPWRWDDVRPPKRFREHREGQQFLFDPVQHLCWSCDRRAPKLRGGAS